MKTTLTHLPAAHTPKRFLQKLLLLLVLLVSAVTGARAQLAGVGEDMVWQKKIWGVSTSDYGSWAVIRYTTVVNPTVLENNSAEPIKKTVTVDESPYYSIKDFTLESEPNDPVEIAPVIFFSFDTRLFLFRTNVQNPPSMAVGYNGQSIFPYTPFKRKHEYTIPPFSKITVTVTTHFTKWENRSFKFNCSSGRTRPDGSIMPNYTRNGSFSIDNKTSVTVSATPPEGIYPHNTTVRPYDVLAIMQRIKEPNSLELISIAAHRGLFRADQCPDGFYATENSRGAVLHAWQHGYEAIEIDLNSDKNFHAVLSHDGALGAVVQVPANAPGAAFHTVALSGQRYYTAGMGGLNFSAPNGATPPLDQWKLKGDPNDGHNMSRGEAMEDLDGLLKYIHDKGINIVVVLDVKEASFGQMQSWWATVKKYSNARGIPATDWVIFQSNLGGANILFDARKIEQAFGFLDASGQPTAIYGERSRLNFVPILRSQDVDDYTERKLKDRYGNWGYKGYQNLLYDLKARPWFMFFHISQKEYFPVNPLTFSYLRHLKYAKGLGAARGNFNPTFQYPNHQFVKTDGYSTGRLEDYLMYSKFFGYQESSDQRIYKDFFYRESSYGPGDTFVVTDDPRGMHNQLRAKSPFTEDGVAYLNTNRRNQRNLLYYIDRNDGGYYDPIRRVWNKTNLPWIPGGKTAAVAATPELTEAAPDQLSLFPNPATTSCTLSYRSQQAGTAHVSITNLMGLTVATKDFAVEEGDNEQLIVTAGLPAGNYVLALTVDGKTLHSRLVITAAN